MSQSRATTSQTTNPYKGPHASISKILLNPSSPLPFVKEILKEFISSENKFNKEYTFNKGCEVFHMLQYTSSEKLGDNQLRNSDKFEWVRNLLSVFESENNFIGFVGLAGFLNGYQMNRKRSGVGDLIFEVENVFLKSIDSIIDQVNEDSKKETITFICAKCIPFIQTEQLKELNSKARLMHLLMNVVLESPQLFQNGEFLSEIEQNITKNQSWTKHDPFKILKEKSNGILFKKLPEISFVISKLTHVVDSNDISSLLTRINEFSVNLYKLWDESPSLSLIEDDSLKPESKEDMTLVWKVFKYILFSITMIFKSIVDRSLFEPLIYGDRGIMIILSTYSYLYFIASKFSVYGFGVYKKVFFSVLNQTIVNNNSEEIIDIMKNIELDMTLDKPHKKCRIVYYLLVIEQIIKVLDDDYVENHILPTFDKLLLRNDDKNIFESANNVVLSIFHNQKRIAKELGPYYCNYLLSMYPSSIDVRQLRIAYTIVIISLSDIDDALVWSCLEILLKKIKSINPNNSNRRDSISESTQNTEGSTNNKDFVEQQQSTNHQELSEQQKQQEEEEDFTKAALYLRRGYLLLTLIDQVKSINLIFMKRLLTEIKKFFEEEKDDVNKNGSSGAGLKALQKVLFNTLSNEIDYTKKEVGVKWWLNEGSKLLEDLIPGEDCNAATPPTYDLPPPLPPPPPPPPQPQLPPPLPRPPRKPYN